MYILKGFLYILAAATAAVHAPAPPTPAPSPPLLQPSEHEPQLRRKCQVFRMPQMYLFKFVQHLCCYSVTYVTKKKY